MNLLLIEDNEDDILLTQEAVEEIINTGFRINLHIVKNGLEGLAYLENGNKPHLILLDLNMPKMGGIQFLRIIKDSSSIFRRIPICILTTSKSDLDILNAYNHHCSGYLAKPVLFDDFVQIIHQLGKFWFETVTLPPR